MTRNTRDAIAGTAIFIGALLGGFDLLLAAGIALVGAGPVSDLAHRLTGRNR